jgi:hypothetical protein
MKEIITNQDNSKFPCITEGCNGETKYEIMSVTIRSDSYAPVCEQCKIGLDKSWNRTVRNSYPSHSKRIETKIKLELEKNKFYWFEGDGYTETPFHSIDTVIVGWGYII